MKEAEGAAAEIETDQGVTTVTERSLIRGEAEVPAELGCPGEIETDQAVTTVTERSLIRGEAEVPAELENAEAGQK